MRDLQQNWNQSAINANGYPSQDNERNKLKITGVEWQTFRRSLFEMIIIYVSWVCVWEGECENVCEDGHIHSKVNVLAVPGLNDVDVADEEEQIGGLCTLHINLVIKVGQKDPALWPEGEKSSRKSFKCIALRKTLMGKATLPLTTFWEVVDTN